MSARSQLVAGGLSIRYVNDLGHDALYVAGHDLLLVDDALDPDREDWVMRNTLDAFIKAVAEGAA